MARHSHWAQIKRGKAITDASRGKVFTRHARLIEIAVRDGGGIGDVNLNARLAMAVDAAKADDVPRENIERAIKKGLGAGTADKMEERIYEAYAPGGVALLIASLTDNPTRTIANVRNILNKNAGKIAESGSVAFQFERRGCITGTLGKATLDALEMAAIEAEAMDIETDEDEVVVWTAPDKLMAVRSALIPAGMTVAGAVLTYVPTNTVAMSEETAAAVQNLREKLEEDDDVDTVYTNGEE